MGLPLLLLFVRSTQLDHNSPGPCGAQCCQASTTVAALAHGQVKVNRDIAETWCTWKVNEVTMPKLPPPPPRSAQKRSALWFASQVSTCPSATTTWAESRLSQVRPNLRLRTPSPPPSVRPAIPTVAQEPAGSTKPCWARVP